MDPENLFMKKQNKKNFTKRYSSRYDNQHKTKCGLVVSYYTQIIWRLPVIGDGLCAIV